ncbi:MAG: class II glutamine amidotransferase [Alphaproteobacteria bacterium]
MCRWIAYTGKPVYMDTLVTRPEHSLVVQSLNAKMRYNKEGSILATNGDGFGVGWYGEKKEPGLYKVSEPAWSNENIHEICSHTKAHIFMAHIREATMGEVQRSNTHPFKYKNWLFQHNGRIEQFNVIRRALEFDIDPSLYPLVKGNTDSEVFFFLALTYGLEKNPRRAVEQTISRVERACVEHGIPAEIALSLAISDGVSLYTTRYAKGLKTDTQYYSTHADCMKEINGSSCAKIPHKGVVVVSEPLDHSEEYWQEMPEYSFASIKNGRLSIEKLECL